MKVNPQCYDNSRNTYTIDASGIFFPCCFVGAEFWRDNPVLTPEEADMMSLSKHTFEEIINSGVYEKWLNMIEGDDPIEPCQMFCSKKNASKLSFDSNEKYFDGTNLRTKL